MRIVGYLFVAHFGFAAKCFCYFTYLSFPLGMIGYRLNSVATFSSLILFRSQCLWMLFHQVM